MRYLKTIRSMALLVLIALACGSCSRDQETGEQGRLKIAVIPKGTTHVFWKSVEAGAQEAGAQLGVDIIWKGPLKENDRAQQIALVEQFATEGVDGIVLAPLDESALLRPVRAAMGRNVPVVIIDSDLRGEVGKDFVSFVATDNRKGGYLAGEQMAKLLNGNGKVLLLRYMVGSASTTNREAGFLDAISQHPGIELISENQYAGSTAGEAIQKSEELLDQLRLADGVFCPNESSTYGMLVTLRKNQLSGKLVFLGFDSSEELIGALREGTINALVVQNPRRMGNEGVRVVVDLLSGKDVPRRVDTGVTLVTPENLEEPQIQELVTPL